MKKILAIFGAVALLDLIPDGQMDATKYAYEEIKDAARTTWDTGARQFNRLTQ